MHGFAALIESYEEKCGAYLCDVEQRKALYQRG